VRRTAPSTRAPHTRAAPHVVACTPASIALRGQPTCSRSRSATTIKLHRNTTRGGANSGRREREPARQRCTTATPPPTTPPRSAAQRTEEQGPASKAVVHALASYKCDRGDCRVHAGRDNHGRQGSSDGGGGSPKQRPQVLRKGPTDLWSVVLLLRPRAPGVVLLPVAAAVARCPACAFELGASVAAALRATRCGVVELPTAWTASV
jgi:hypothetical protein